jgi:hypothetical protein
MLEEGVFDESLKVEWYFLARILYDAGLLRIVISGNYL